MTGWKARAQAAEQALSDLKREVLEKVGPFARYADQIEQMVPGLQVVLDGRGAALFVRDFRALSTLHDKLSSDVFPESPSGDVSTHAAGEAEGSTSPNESAS